MKSTFYKSVHERIFSKESILLVVFLFLLLSQDARAGNSWSSKKDFGGGSRFYATGFMIGTKGYIGTGTTAGVYGTKDFWKWDPSTNAWTQKADFGGGNRMGAVGFSIGSKGYIGTGSSSYLLSDNVNDFWQYDTSSNTWTQKTNYSGTTVSNAVGFSIGDKGYIGTGAFLYGSTHYASDFYEYDTASDSWSQKANFGGGSRSDAVGFSIGSKGYIGTGSDGSVQKDFWEYNPSTDKWTQKADFGGSVRQDAIGFSIGSKGYIGTGSDELATNVYADFYEYSPSANTWTQKTNYGTSLCGAVGFANCTKGYIGTGYEGSGSNTYYKYFEEYIPSVTPEAVISANKTELCQGGSVNFSDSSTNGPTSWNWTFKGGSPDTSTAQNPSNIVFTSPGNYTVTLVASNLNCSSTTSQTITVDALPTVTAYPPSPKICSGNSVSITAYGAATYSWSPFTGLSSTTNQTVTAQPTSTTTYTITGTSSIGCSNSATVTVTVNPNPTVSVSPASKTICQGDVVKVSASGASTYFWSPSAGLSSTIGATVTASPTISTSYTVTGTDANGCTNTASVPITVNPLPNANAGNDVTICGGSTNLLASGGTSYSWSPATGLSCTNCSNPVASPSATTKYTVTVTNGNGCSKTASVTVTIATSITANAGSDSAICDGKSTMLNASGGTGYSWYPTIGLSNPNIPNPLASPSATTTYTVIVSSGTCTPDSNSVTITVNPVPPVPTISVNGTTLASSSSTGNQWQLNGTNIPGATSQFLTATQNGFYTVCVANANGCSSCSNVFSYSAIEPETMQSNDVRIFPNPNNGLFNISFSCPQENTVLIMYNMLGEKIFSSTVHNENLEINISAQPKGTYLLELKNENGIINKKLITE